jgi:DGQHR domain-containing protein
MTKTTKKSKVSAKAKSAAKKAPAKKRAALVEIINKRALRLVQAEGVEPLFQFSLTGEELQSIADISRITRDDQGKLIGYQRAEVRKHVDGIAEYLDGDKPLMPNPIILAFSGDVKFVGSRGPSVSDGYCTSGHLEIPIPVDGGKRPAWIVDGQQRTLALAKCARQDMAVPVVGFIAENIEVQREQFLLVNNTKPLPRGLVTELLPEVDTTLPPRMAQNKIPAKLCDLLNQHPDSPFFGLIKRPSMTREEAKGTVIRDTSVVDMLRESMSNVSGSLCSYRNLATGDIDIEAIWRLLLVYWGAVKASFPEAWGRSPRESRLMGGVGISALGKLMDKVMPMVDLEARNVRSRVQKDLELVAPHCAWTSGRWEGLDGRRWDEIKNLPSHKRLVANYLIRVYTEEKRARG